MRLILIYAFVTLLVSSTCYGECSLLTYVDVVKGKVLGCETPEEYIRSWVKQRDPDEKKLKVDEILHNYAAFLDGTTVKIAVTKKSQGYVNGCTSFLKDREVKLTQPWQSFKNDTTTAYFYSKQCPTSGTKGTFYLVRLCCDIGQPCGLLGLSIFSTQQDMIDHCSKDSTFLK